VPAEAGATFATRREALASAASVRTSEQGWRLNLLLWMLLSLTNFVDVLGTARAFDMGIGELNPIVEMAHAAWGMIGVAAPKALFLAMLLFLLPWIRSWTRALFGFATCIYLALTGFHIWYLSPLL
jgi:hypothetical protein